jgi:membrane-associated phospholipid phosphatase
MASAPTQVAQRGHVPTGVTGPRVRAVAMTAYAGLLALWCVEVGVPRQLLVVFGWLWLATIAWNIRVPPRHHLAFLRDWWLVMVGLIVYISSRGLSDSLGVAPHFSMPVEVDSWLGGGTTPTERLQAAWCGTPCHRHTPGRWYDVVLSTVYLTHFLAGLTLAMLLWLRNRAEWVRWMRRYMTISYSALVVYVLYPMAPPWMAARDGYLPHDVHRLTGRGWAVLSPPHGVDMALQGGNQVAAMPSLHTGMACLIALYGVQRLRSPARWLLVAYPVAMATALVYDGEHYLVDVLAGALLAALVLLACQLWEASRGDPPPRGGRDPDGRALSPPSASPRG